MQIGDLVTCTAFVCPVYNEDSVRIIERIECVPFVAAITGLKTVMLGKYRKESRCGEWDEPFEYEPPSLSVTHTAQVMSVKTGMRGREILIRMEDAVRYFGDYQIPVKPFRPKIKENDSERQSTEIAASPAK